MDRRAFLRRTGLAGGALTCGSPAWAQPAQGGVISLVLDPSDPVASAAPARWAAGELEQALANAGCTVHRRERPQQAGAGEFCIVASGGSAPVAAAALKTAGISMPRGPEALALLNVSLAGHPALLACGSDPRGLSYALLELADSVRLGPGLAPTLKIAKPVVERPANPVRSVMRQFTCERLDKPWFYDREMWPRYLAMLAAQRFNRFHLGFGLGYDTLPQVVDSYFLFLYPFLLSAPGYNVRATNLPDAERDRNLETLRFIGEQTVAHGIEFQLGIWMHGYLMPDSPRARYVIEGLTPETHALYCRDALTTLLRACPAISAVALRIHGESGVAEGSYDFWKAVFDGVKRCGRAVEIDLHAKGIDAAMIDNAVATGMPVNVSPKYWAEHLGMPYHQAAIRDQEMPVPGRVGAGLMALSEGSRSFTRYGYADLLRDDRKYTVRHRIFSGTQRILLSGDPVFAASYGRMFQFCGSTGADWMEPLTCRGRQGSGDSGNRIGYVDARLEPHWDWEKYLYWYRVLGRLMYNPETAPAVWRRQFGGSPQAAALESALANASRILPIVTTAHLPSASCQVFWPEVYWNQPMLLLPGTGREYNPYSDTPSPRTFQHVSPLDPQLFSRISDFAAELLAGERGAKYSPIEVAQWLEDYADAAGKALQQAGKLESVELSRAAIDADMQAGLGRFFAAKLRSGVLFAIHERTGDRRALEEALKSYRSARSMFARVADRAKGVYQANLAVSKETWQRGSWLDSLPAMDRDIALIEQRLASATVAADPRVAAAIAEALGRPRRESAVCRHRPPAGFQPGKPVALAITVEQGRKLASLRLYYRHVNQAERYETAEMELSAGAYHASIPAPYTDSPYPLQYYFELQEAPDKAWFYPGFAPDLANLPYFELHRT
ncbi:MAG: twin-arginine translocation signal domain-containing protein [Bryobacteraceae bacterium]